MKLFQGKRKRKILFLVLFLACVGFGIWSIFMDSSDSINVITQLQQQQKVTPEVTPEVTQDDGKGYSEETYVDLLTKASKQAGELIEEVKEKINTTNDSDSESEEEEGSIFDWWWTLVAAYFLFKLFLGD